jgi:GTP-dependent phosphoenolpyruvate carboxykinase
MKASAVTFEQMRRAARNNPSLAVPSSYLQVEYGISELHACWDGFVHTSDHYEQTFKNRKEIYQEFANALGDYLEYLGEQIPESLGQEISSHS